MKKPQGLCPRCHGKYSINDDGTIRRHASFDEMCSTVPAKALDPARLHALTAEPRPGALAAAGRAIREHIEKGCDVNHDVARHSANYTSHLDECVNVCLRDVYDDLVIEMIGCSPQTDDQRARKLYKHALEAALRRV